MTAKHKEVEEVKEPKKPKIVWGTYLRDEVVNVRPVESSGKWNTLLVKGQDKKKDPFIYNKVKRSFQVPLNNFRRGGGVQRILDDQERRQIKKYINTFPNGMTQQEFFEKELGKDLNPTLPNDDNFWRSSRLGRVTMTKEGLRLDLGLTVDMLKYLILLSNEKLVSPSYEGRLKRATYDFIVVDEGKLTSKKVEEATVKANAYAKFAELTNGKTKMIGFLKSLGRSIPAAVTEDWIKNEVLSVLEEGPSQFLSIVNHPQYEQKIFIQEAIEAGAIKKMNERRYTLDNGIELGDLHDTINYIHDPENQEVKMRVTARIELAQKK